MEDLSFLSKYTNLDKFQLEAFDIIKKSNPENILITAHTGSGKSLVAEYGIYHNIKVNNKKVIYTSPIKSLSNQKFYDFNQKFKSYDISIGILTGDIKFAPQADCVIMTTEILLNQLLKYITKVPLLDSDIDFNNVGCIVFDEVHYINDIDRGNVWEQSIMYIPNHIHLIMLSATLHNPEKFGSWIESVQHKPTIIISTTHRVVPLYFNIYYSVGQGMFKKIPKEKQNIIPFNELIEIANTDDKKYNFILYDKIIKYDENIIKLLNYRYNVNNIINEMLRDFNHENYTENMFPLLFFVLNKKKCIDIAKSLNIIFNTGLEQNEVENYVNSIIRNMNLHYLKKIAQFELVFELAKKGIGIHHSGLLPIIKEIVEQLYEMKLIKVLFATETFAVGLNMPTKTVVFTDLSKFSGNSFRNLHSYEFIQMAGRAGRRNIDTKGYVILLPQLFKNQLTSIELKNIIYGGGQVIQSKLNIDELLILRLLKNNNTIEDLIYYVKNSMLAENTESQIKQQTEIVNRLKLIYDNYTKEDFISVKKYRELTEYGFTLNKKQRLELNILLEDKMLKEKTKFISNYEIEFNKLSDLINILKINIEYVLNILLDNNMIEYNDYKIILTNRGYIGSQITDINPILLTDIITSEFFQKLDIYNIISLLFCIISEDHLKDPIQIYGLNYDNIEWKDDIKKIIESYQNDKYKSTLIDIFNFDYLWLVDEFFRTSEYKSYPNDNDYLFEGNFARSISKLLNLLNEIKLIIEKQDIELNKKIDECIIMLKKDWLNSNSIYLTQNGIII